MQMEQQVSLDREASPHPENISFEVGDCAVIASPQIYDVPVQPAKKKAKKQTRQWAAWTRQEEESFFTALRLVGKNFEKITSRVQSKNKDQVRYYYYRLVRRMNKLLGPELFLDAKNSKFTNAAMLRWWSLLEKYSCKASKLHLKPRTFKRFIEALEDQLKKDRKKHLRTRHFQGENCSSTSGSNQARASRFDSSAVNVVLENLNIRKLTSGKRSSLRRNAKIGINRSNCKVDSSPVKIARQRRKKGTASTAAYKKWEKAAIAGVSLVADAAEHLERSAVEKVAEHVQDIQGQKDIDPVGKDVPSLASSSPNLFIDNNIQVSLKLKLQLFPIDEGTRRALETDNHNPHLELTLSTRKKISSVLEHLNRKWGSSSIASGELVLFPYCVEKENIASCQKWTQDSVLSAADVYALIGSPPVFRLRYGWFSNAKHGSAIVEEPLASFNIFGEHKKCTNDTEPFVDSIPPTDIVSATSIAPSSSGGRTEIVECVIADSGKNHLESSEHSQTIPSQRREVGNGSITRQVEYMDYLRIRNGNTLSAVEWADSLTNISVGDLLSEASHNMDAICVDPAPPSSSQCLQQVPFTCDSFDAAIAAHIRKNQGKTAFQPSLEAHSSSIWEAEETCDGFSFHKNSVFYQKVERAPRDASPEASKRSAKEFLAPATAVEELPEVMEPMDADLANGDPMHVCHPGDNSVKDLRGLTDIYWPDSLGQLDLEIPSCRYQSEDQILSDSLGGLNRLIASSLDAFQNCAFFGLDKREPVSSIEARETASFSDHKVSSEV